MYKLFITKKELEKADKPSSSAFSDFFRKASSAEKKQVFSDVARKASETQRAYIQ